MVQVKDQYRLLMVIDFKYWTKVQLCSRMMFAQIHRWRRSWPFSNQNIVVDEVYAISACILLSFYSWIYTAFAEYQIPFFFIHGKPEFISPLNSSQSALQIFIFDLHIYPGDFDGRTTSRWEVSTTFDLTSSILMQIKVWVRIPREATFF